MVLKTVQIFSVVFLRCSIIAVGRTDLDRFLHSSPAKSSFDPLLSEFVWFSSFTSPDEVVSNNGASFVLVRPYMLPGSLEPLTHMVMGRESDKAPEAPKMAIRL